MGRSRRQESPSGFDQANSAQDAARSARGAMARLRYAYFAHAGDTAGRYGLRFDDIVTHLWRFRITRGRVQLAAVRHLDDLVHAVACADGIEAAWTDLLDRHEPVLIRRCAERLGDMQSILLVRRMFATLRGPETLAGYLGDRPLRTWLAERVMGQLSTVWCAPAPTGARGPRVWQQGPLVVTAGRRRGDAPAVTLQFPTELTRFAPTSAGADTPPDAPGRLADS